MLAIQVVPPLTNQDEDDIEAAYWAFDAERNKTGVERDAFKGQLRRLLRTTKAELLKQVEQRQVLADKNEKVVRMVRALWTSGYDGPFIGAPVEKLFAALAKLERE